MEKLFRLYRYLSQCKRPEDEDNSYNVALRTLEPVLDNLAELESWGQNIIDTGGIQWDDADKITERIIEHHKTALCEYSATGLEAVINFASTHIQTNEWDELIARCQEQKSIAEKAEEDYRALFEDGLDTHPF